MLLVCDCGYWDEMFVAPFYQLSTYKLVDAQHEFKVLRAHVCIFRIQRTCCTYARTASSSLWLCSPAQCLGEICPKNQENWQALSRSFAAEIQAVAFVLQIPDFRSICFIQPICSAVPASVSALYCRSRMPRNGTKKNITCLADGTLA
jgi:hypothetical protein